MEFYNKIKKVLMNIKHLTIHCGVVRMGGFCYLYL